MIVSAGADDTRSSASAELSHGAAIVSPLRETVTVI